LLFHRALEPISRFAQISDELICLGASIGRHLRNPVFQRRKDCVHLVNALFGLIKKKVDTAPRRHYFILLGGTVILLMS